MFQPNPNSKPNEVQTTWHTFLGDIVPRPWGYSIQEQYHAEVDLPFLTRVLINSGYRLYNLHRADSDSDERVWAKPKREVVGWKKELVYGHEVETEPVIEDGLPDLSGIMVGEVSVLPLDGEEVNEYDTILLSDFDGGMVNSAGTVTYQMTRPAK